MNVLSKPRTRWIQVLEPTKGIFAAKVARICTSRFRTNSSIPHGYSYHSSESSLHVALKDNSSKKSGENGKKNGLNDKDDDEEYYYVVWEEDRSMYVILRRSTF